MALEQTREQRLRNMVMLTGADPANAVIAEPGSEGHSQPHDTWAAPVMVVAGERPAGMEGAGLPWLYLACHCGWWLGYGPQFDPAGFARVARIHGEHCELKPSALEGTRDGRALLRSFDLAAEAEPRVRAAMTAADSGSETTPREDTP
jgi:hypothetical protein